MPLALTLQQVLRTLRAGATALAPWTEIVPLEATIVERARSAFLVHWFGRRLPFDGLSLRAHIVNTGALAQQHLLAQRSIPTSERGANLTEPLAGFAGMVGGMLLTPFGAAAGIAVMFRVADVSVKTVLAALALIVAPGLLGFGLAAAPLGTLVFTSGLVAAAAGGFALAAGLGDRQEIRAVFDLFGALARLMDASLILLQQLMGDRSEMRNPLLARLVELAAPLAAVFAQLLGAVAVAVRRIGPVLPSVAGTLVAIGGLVQATGPTLGEILRGLLARLESLRSGPFALTRVFTRITSVAREQLARVQAALAEHVEAIANHLRDVGRELRDALLEFAARAADFVGKLFTEHPIVQTIQAFRTQVGVIMAAWASTPSPPTDEPSALAPLIAALPPVPPVPSFPELPAAPDAARVRAALGGASVPALDLASIEQAAERLGASRPSLELSAEAQAAVERSIRRASAFGPERRALAQELGRPPSEALELNREALEGFRQALAVVVGRVLPPEMRAVYAPQLAETMAEIDRQLYAVDHALPETFPVLDLPSSDRLQPVVTKLRLRMPGAHLNDVRRFRDLVIDRLQQQPYVAEATTPLGAGAP